MAQTRNTLHLRPEQGIRLEGGPEVLRTELEGLAEDREATARALVLSASALVEAWARGRPMHWGAESAHLELSEALTDLDREHGWRGTYARWRAALDGALHLAGESSGPARELLAEELGLWRGGIDELSGEGAETRRPPILDAGPSLAAAGAGRRAGAPADFWTGEPLGRGARLPRLDAGARRIASELSRGETIGVHGWSPAAAEALETLSDLGLAPMVVVSEGGADLGGRRMARRLAERGLAVRMVYDLALLDELAAADRLWVGCEAIGAGQVIARRGTRALLAEALRLEVPATLVTTSDELAPGGAVALPAWPEREQWLLWEDAPESVELSSQCFERVPDSLFDCYLTEVGWESAGDLAMRALQVGAPASTRD
jgi:hypothetical protein